MNELYAQLEHFLRALGVFNGEMAKNWDELQAAWDHAAEIWTDDDTRQRFEADWGDMAAALRLYRHQHGEHYEDFLLRKKLELDAYFGKR